MSARRLLLLIGLLIGPAGCATPPPALPSDTSSIGHTGAALALTADEQTLDCQQVRQLVMRADQQIAETRRHVTSHRIADQLAGYFAAVLFLPLVAVATENPEGRQLDIIYAGRDRLLLLNAAKTCPGLL